MINTYKEYRNKELKYFLITEILMFILLNYRKDFEQLMNQNSLISIFLSSPILYFYCLILDNVVPKNLKNAFSFYLNKDCMPMFFQLPGRTIFSKLKENKIKDLRIDKIKVQQKYRDIFECIKENKATYEMQNSKWLQMKYDLEKHQKNAKLEIAEKEYLLFRDMLSMHILFSVLFYIFHLIRIVNFTNLTFVYIVVAYFVLFLCVRTTSSKFVYEVIVQDSLVEWISHGYKAM